MNQRPVYEIAASGKELRHIGWSKSFLQSFRIASAYGHARGDWRDGYIGSLGEGYAIVPKKNVVEA